MLRFQNVFVPFVALMLGANCVHAQFEPPPADFEAGPTDLVLINGNVRTPNDAVSDWPVVPFVNPWIGIETLVTRELSGGSDEGFGKEQAIRLDEAITLSTVNSAEQFGMGDKLGQLQAGYLADLIILDRDPFTIPVTELHQLVVLKTMIDGEIVYQKTN